MNDATAAPPAPEAIREIQWRAPEDLQPNPRNSKRHPEAQIARIMESVREFGANRPILCDRSGVVIAGHGTLEAYKRLGMPRVPVVVLEHLSESEARAYMIADNKLAELGEWDALALRDELESLRAEDIPLDVLGFDDDELARIFDGLGDGAPVNDRTPAGDDDSDGKPPPTRLEPQPDPGPSVPDTSRKAVTRPGDVWQLGRHRVMCGDSRDVDAVARLMAGKRATLLHADPPYGMGKEALGVENDNLYDEALDRFQLEWWATWRPFLTDNASVYIWGNAPELWRLWYAAPLADPNKRGLGATEPMTLRNEIVWDKKTIAGMASPDLTKYPEATERCLFFQLGRYVLKINQTKEDYWDGWEPIRLWLVQEKERAGWKSSEINKITGTFMHTHWFSRSQWAMITEEHYNKLAAAAEGRAFTRPYADLRREYEEILRVFNGEVRDPRRADFSAVRPFFNNAHDIMRDVWEFPRVVGEERYGHATPKPVAMVERVMKSSAREGDAVAVPFGGSGSDVIAAENVGVSAYVMELSPQWVDAIVRRWQKHTGDPATLDGDGRTFFDLEDEDRE